jgi:hypothetical protein
MRVLVLVLGAGAIVFLLTSILAARKPLPATIRTFQGRPVVVRLWGIPPTVPDGADLLVESVSVIGAGLHVYFNAGPGRPIHLKVAQPRDSTQSSRRVVIHSARYVQWSGVTVAPVAGAPAVVVEVTPTGRPPQAPAPSPTT